MCEEDEEKVKRSYTNRTFLRTEKERKEAKEETEKCERCDCPDDFWAFNCGSDCIYHKKREDDQHEIEDNLRPCRCTCEDKAGMIESRDYCTFKKTGIADELELDNIDFELEGYDG